MWAKEYIFTNRSCLCCSNISWRDSAQNQCLNVFSDSQWKSNTFMWLWKWIWKSVGLHGKYFGMIMMILANFLMPWDFSVAKWQARRDPWVKRDYFDLTKRNVLQIRDSRRDQDYREGGRWSPFPMTSSNYQLNFRAINLNNHRKTSWTDSLELRI